MRKHRYHVREDSPLYKIGFGLLVIGFLLLIGVLNTWELGLL